MSRSRYARGMGSAIFVMACGLAFPSAGLAQFMPLQSAASLAPSSGEQVAPPGGIVAGPLILYPALELSLGHNDNLLSSDINKRGSSQMTLSPSIRAEARPGPHKIDVLFRANDVRYASSPADNYSDASLAGTADLVVSGRAGLKLRAEQKLGFDPRGSTDRGASASPDEYINQGVDGIFSYGAPGAKGRIEIDGGAFSRRYQNNRLTTAASDRNTTQLGGTFLWRVAPKTELLALVQRREIDYVDPVSTQDSSETRYQLGAKWEATAKTAGIVKLGRLEKTFNSAVRTNFSGASWDGAVRWSPLTYSVLDFNTSKATNESTGTGDFLLTQSYGVTWNHAWNSRFSSATNASWRKDEFLGTGGGREDKTSILGVKLTYQWQRWLRFGGEYTWTERSSNQNTFDFTRHLFMFTIGATL